MSKRKRMAIAGRFCAMLALIALYLTFGLVNAGAQSAPYSAVLRTDPDVGNIQGIQRYGRTLRTDPDEGDGFAFHVFPVADGTVSTVGASTVDLSQTPQAQDLLEKLRVINVELQKQKESIETHKQMLAVAEKKTDKDEEDLEDIRDIKAAIKVKSVASRHWQQKLNAYRQAYELYLQSGQQAGGVVPIAPTQSADVQFDATAGMRQFGVAGPQIVTDSPFQTGVQAPLQAAIQAVGVNRTLENGKVITTTSDIYHQPLIQVKVRVVEVARNDSLQTASILDYVSQDTGVSSLINGNNVNEDDQNVSGGTRFDQAGLIDFTGNSLSSLTPAGVLVNLTSEHINYITRLLSTELNGDVVTAPQVVTLNGQNVEFIAGQKLPFQLGQNVIQGNSNNVQQFFYKHVGTFISVTPRIVDWGLHGEGQGNGAIGAAEIGNWNQLAKWMKTNNLLGTDLSNTAKVYYEYGRPVPITIKEKLLKQLNVYTRKQLYEIASTSGETPFAEAFITECAGCNWSPEECTIDLSIVVRLSDLKELKVDANLGGGRFEANTESGVRGIANILQVKSGHGVVMAGLIGEREVEDTSKVPVLGDLPVVGYLFRSRAVSRQKTELVIFVEAQVLDRDPYSSRAASQKDFLLSQPYVEGDLLDNPLEYGACRAGFGTYLPQATHNEKIFWERHARRIRKIETHLGDAFK